jgi:molybdopterin converting factor small subunit
MTKAKGRSDSVLIRVNGYAGMKRFTRHLSSGAKMEVPDGSTVETVLRMLCVPLRQEKITMVNGRRCDMAQALEPGDHLIFFPPLEGG